MAGISLVGPWYHLIVAIANLFGMGGNSLISRMLGAKRDSECKGVSAFSVYGAALTGVLFSLGSAVFTTPLLTFLGASEYTFSYARSYLYWVVIIGAVPSLISLVLAHLLRSEGHAKKSSFGLMLGGVMNMILDPIFIFPFDMGVTGAALATMLSNVFSCGYFLLTFYRLRHESVMSFLPRDFSLRCAGEVFSVGFTSFLNALLASIADLVVVRLSANYSDIALAAYGIVKKLDQFPLKTSLGLCQGVMPIIGYNFGAKNYKRMRATLNFSWKLSFAFCGGVILLFQVLAHPIVFWFIPDAETAAVGAALLRLACLAVPFHAMNILLNYTILAMGQGAVASRITFLRHGVLNIPLMFILDHFFGLYGMICSLLAADLIALPFAAVFCAREMRKITDGQ